MSLRILSCSKAVSPRVARHRFRNPVLRSSRIVKGTSRDYFILAAVSRSCSLRAQTNPASRSSRKSRPVRRLRAHCHALIRHSCAWRHVRRPPHKQDAVPRGPRPMPSKPHTAGLAQPSTHLKALARGECARDVVCRRARRAPEPRNASTLPLDDVRVRLHTHRPRITAHSRTAARTSSEIKDLRARLDRRRRHGMSNRIFSGCDLYNAGRLTTLQFPGADPGWMPFELVWAACATCRISDARQQTDRTSAHPDAPLQAFAHAHRMIVVTPPRGPRWMTSGAATWRERC